MVQATDLGNRYDRPHPGRLNGPPKRRILAEREVRAGALVVIEVRFQDAPQTGLIQDDHVIQAFPTNRADQSLNVGVLPGRLRCCENLTDAKPAGCLLKFLSVAPIPIAQQVMWGAVPRKSFQQLVSPPIQPWDIPSPPRGRAAGGRATESRRQIRLERTRSEPRRSRRRPYPLYGLPGTCARFARVVCDDAPCTWQRWPRRRNRNWKRTLRSSDAP